MALLEVEDLRVSFETEDGVVRAVDGVSYALERGRALGIVGESGSGKSVSSLAVMGLTRFASNAVITGSVRFDGIDLLAASNHEMRGLRGNDVAMIFQDPLSSLHPFYRIGDQLVEAIRAHRDVPAKAARSRAAQMLERVGIPDPGKRLDAFPHEFSGGMRQRVMIAMSLVNEPKLLIADEPTTALDVTVQAQVLDLIRSLQSELDTAIVMITHDLGVVAEITDEIAVMYAGRIVERGDTDTIFNAPEHPYTWGLLRSIPRLSTPLGSALVPIAGRPPSLINRPPGCAFHPRCPFVRDDHRRIDPRLSESAEGVGHGVACLLPADSRRALWSELRLGATPDDARHRVRVPRTLDQGAIGRHPGGPVAGVAAPETGAGAL